jgi:hypothetical protein
MSKLTIELSDTEQNLLIHGLNKVITECRFQLQALTTGLTADYKALKIADKASQELGGFYKMRIEQSQKLIKRLTV